MKYGLVQTLSNVNYLLTALASAGEKSNFSMKKTLEEKRRQDDAVCSALALTTYAAFPPASIILAPICTTTERLALGAQYSGVEKLHQSLNDLRASFKLRRHQLICLTVDPFSKPLSVFWRPLLPLCGLIVLQHSATKTYCRHGRCAYLTRPSIILPAWPSNIRTSCLRVEFSFSFTQGQ